MESSDSGRFFALAEAQAIRLAGGTVPVRPRASPSLPTLPLLQLIRRRTAPQAFRSEGRLGIILGVTALRRRTAAGAQPGCRGGVPIGPRAAPTEHYSAPAGPGQKPAAAPTDWPPLDTVVDSLTSTEPDPGGPAGPAPARPKCVRA